jgi:hypothetical protein
MGGNDKLTPFSELAWNGTVDSQALGTVSPQPRVVYPTLLIYDISGARMHGWRPLENPRMRQAAIAVVKSAAESQAGLPCKIDLQSADRRI